MITRIVKMTFKPDTIGLFLQYLPDYQEAIRGSKGCNFLQILQDQNNPCIVFTYSHWDSTNDLDTYRNSALFEKVWGQVRQWFDDKPQAWSLNTVFSL